MSRFARRTLGRSLTDRTKKYKARLPSGKAVVCKTTMSEFDSRPRLMREKVKTALFVILLILLAIALAYDNYQVTEECMKEGHSASYCRHLLNK